LEIGNPSQAINRLEEDEKMTLSSNDSHSGQRGGAQSYTIINEPGLYSLVLGSRKPEARAFKRWITHEVVPAIRRHGMYATNELLDNPDLLIEAATRIKVQREKIAALETTVAVQSQQLAEAAPKVSYYDLILNCKDLISISKIAKDYGMSAVRMNETLRELGIQFRQGNVWLLYQKYAAQGYTSTKTHEYIGSDGTNHARTATYWTQKGRVWLYNKLKENGILPVSEREVS
jgi:phage antirepressor YoqD-like protein